MGRQITTSFTAYELTEQETLEGSVLTGLQKQVLQNYLSTYAEEKIALDYDPSNKEGFLQQEADLKGKIQLIQYLLDSSRVAEENLTAVHTNTTI